MRLPIDVQYRRRKVHCSSETVEVVCDGTERCHVEGSVYDEDERNIDVLWLQLAFDP